MTPHPFAEKVRFFDALDALNCPDDEEDELQDEAEIEHRKICRAYFAPRRGPEQFVGLIATREPGAPKRTRSEPTPTKATPQSKIIDRTPCIRAQGGLNGTLLVPDNPLACTSFVEDTPAPTASRTAHSVLTRSATSPLPTTSSPRSGSPSNPTMADLRKRKRGPAASAKALPESVKVFRGLSFYYIPDNEIAPARKIRIGRARDYGARWSRSLESATHAIVDKNLAYKDVEKILQRADPSVIVVNEDYPIDCITYRHLLNPHQQRYCVTGRPISKETPAASQQGRAQEQAQEQGGQQGSNESLPLKEPQRNPKRWDYVPASIGGQHSEESSARNSAMNEPSAEVSVEQLGHVSASSNDLGEATVGSSQPQELTTAEPAMLDLQSEEMVTDELSEVISLHQKYKDLPLDEDDDDFHVANNADDAEAISDTDSGSAAESDQFESGPSGKRRKTGQKRRTMEESFACFHGGTKDSPGTASKGPNTRTVEVLQAMCDYYERVGDHWRTTAYRKVITTLRRHPSRVTTEEEALALPGVGPRLAQKIAEIAATDGLRRLDAVQDGDPRDAALALFRGVYEVGNARAARWVARGLRTLDDVRAAHAAGQLKLTPAQEVGLEHHADLAARIPRAEVAAIAAHIRAAAATIDPRVELLVGGSYRRGAESSGDVDLIVTRAGTTAAGELAPFLGALTAALMASGFLVAAFTGAGTAWHGCCALPEAAAGSVPGFRPGVWRRLDFLLVPESEYGAALIYFTGNDIFNRSIRLLASRKGMRLNQRGLYRNGMRGPAQTKATEGELVEGRDEKRIFEILGVNWREPKERWC